LNANIISWANHTRHADCPSFLTLLILSGLINFVPVSSVFSAGD